MNRIVFLNICFLFFSHVSSSEDRSYSVNFFYTSAIGDPTSEGLFAADHVKDCMESIIGTVRTNSLDVPITVWYDGRCVGAEALQNTVKFTDDNLQKAFQDDSAETRHSLFGRVAFKDICNPVHFRPDFFPDALAKYYAATTDRLPVYFRVDFIRLMISVLAKQSQKYFTYMDFGKTFDPEKTKYFSGSVLTPEIVSILEKGSGFVRARRMDLPKFRAENSMHIVNTHNSFVLDTIKCFVLDSCATVALKALKADESTNPPTVKNRLGIMACVMKLYPDLTYKLRRPQKQSSDEIDFEITWPEDEKSGEFIDFYHHKSTSTDYLSLNSFVH